jgi:hypothetical protein
MWTAPGDTAIDCSNAVSNSMPVSTDFAVATETHNNGTSADCQAKTGLANNFVCGQTKAATACAGWYFYIVLCRCDDVGCSEPVLLYSWPTGWDQWVKIFDPVIVPRDSWCSREFGDVVY